MQRFMASRAARVALVAVASILLGGGIATHLSSDVGLVVAFLFVFLGVGIGVIGIWWFADDVYAAALGVVLLPFALLLFMPFALYVAYFGHAYGDLLLVAAAPCLTWGFRPVRRTRVLAEEPRLRAV
jgi:hypothetical protein